MKIPSLFLKFLHKLRVVFLLKFSLKPEKEQAKLIATLRQEVSALPELNTDGSLEKQWVEYRRIIRREIIGSDPRNFLNWPAIRSSMYYESDKAEYDFLKSRPEWVEWQKIIKNFSVGRPRPYFLNTKTNGNLIHNAYLIARLFGHFNLDFNSICSVTEFGGGWGAMGLCFNRAGFKGIYSVYDLPEFCFLQEYFTKAMEMDWAVEMNPKTAADSSLNLFYNFDCFRSAFKDCPTDLFIAAWSLSETPLSFRQEFLHALGEPKYFIIGYRDKFANIDNVEFFSRFVQSKQDNYEWANLPLGHLPNNFLLLGKKINVPNSHSKI